MFERLRSDSARIGVASAILALVAAGAVFSNSPGWYIADARFEYYWAGEQFIVRQQWLWDSVRGLGQPTPYFSPVVGSFLGLVQAFGASPALGERILHGTYLLVAGLGMLQVLRLFRARVGAEHVLAAIAYMFSPFTTQFLVPSGLFLHYAISPWLLAACVRGVRGPERWRWAAMFALVIFVVGGLNPPALLYAAVPLIPALLYLMLVDRSVNWKAVAAWTWRAGLLTLLISSATLVYLRFNLSGIVENLGATELPATVNRNSSWSETWRGLGNWLTYFRETAGLLRPESAGYFSNALVIAATFAVPVVALCTVWRSRWRPRLLFAAIAVVSLILMVGLYPIEHAVPAGRVLQFAYDNSLLLHSLRNTYKAGAGLGIGMSALFGVGVADAARSLTQRLLQRGHQRVTRARWARRIVFTLAALVVALASFPFWSGHLYSRADRVKRVPQYWYNALDWLDHRPGDGRVLVLPGSTRTRYRWGYVGDDIFDALLSRPHLVRASLSQGSPEAANLLVALNDAALGPAYEPGSIGAIARRLGVRWVVIRNDIDWQATNGPRPSELDGIRRDSDFERVATFGRRGQNVARSDDKRAAALGETSLTPVEVYRVRAGRSPVQFVAPSPPLLISGDGDAWPRLSSDGTLDAEGPVRYTAALAPMELSRLIAEGAGIVITDTNRRRVTSITTSRNLVSYTLAGGERLDRAPGDLFHRPGSQSVASFGDARRITASVYGNPFVNEIQTWFRPSNAFDGDPNTAWMVGGLTSPVGQWVRVDFKRPTKLDRVNLTPAATSDRSISRVELRFSDGSSVPVALDGTPTTKAFTARTTTSLEVRIVATRGFPAGMVGFSDISVPRLDLVEMIAVPTDVARAAAHDRRLERRVATAPVTFSFQRLVGNGAADAEGALRRKFETIGSRDYVVNGTLRLTRAAPASVIRLVRGGSLTTSGCVTGVLEIDGRPAPVHLEDPTHQLGAGGTIRFGGCERVQLAAGTHRLESQRGLDGLVDRVSLTAGTSSTVRANSRRGTVRVLAESPTRVHLRITAPAGGYLITGQSFSQGWRATANGHALTEPQSLNTLTGWRLPRPGVFDVVVSYEPQRLWEAALAVTGGTVALCLWLVIPRRRHRREAESG